MSACNGPPGVRTLSGMVAMAGEAEKEVEDGKPKKVMDDHDIRWLCPARVALSDHFHPSIFMVKLMWDGF